jgi:acyl-CoA ligase (AMP-forming) (exosortase A-associated)
MRSTDGKPNLRFQVPPVLLHDLLSHAAACWPEKTALTEGKFNVSYAELQRSVEQKTGLLLTFGLKRTARVALYLEKSIETVAASFAVTAAAGVLVPVNPLLKAAQVVHILRDAGASVLVTSEARLPALLPFLNQCPDLQHVVLNDSGNEGQVPFYKNGEISFHYWTDRHLAIPMMQLAAVETDMAVIFYTSGSTGLPKGVVLSHRNLVAGAGSVASYLLNDGDDSILAVLPLSFDAGFSQITTSFLVGARVVLLTYVMPRDVLNVLFSERITGLTAVPPLYVQLAGLQWPAADGLQLRYWANTGGHLPRTTLMQLRRFAPAARPYLMYGLTEAFRSTYLPPEQIDLRPGSIGRAIPNAQVCVVREDGSECSAGEPGELVHRGPLVALGYWNRPEETAQRFRSWPAALTDTVEHLPALEERAVYSGDTVQYDTDGYLYFVARKDDMIKSSGYRISPSEVEDALYRCPLVAEALVYAKPDELLGSAVCAAVFASALATGNPDQDSIAVMSHVREYLPAFMCPRELHWTNQPFPRNPNGKLDRQHWVQEHGKI